MSAGANWRHRENPMLKTEQTSQKREVDQKSEVFTLSLTADELTWLEQVMAAALRVYDKKPETGLAAELRVNRQQWRDQLYEQGWPF
jgi:hypothetical protein